MANNFRHLKTVSEANIMSRILVDIGIYSKSYRVSIHKQTCIEILKDIKQHNSNAIILINPISRWLLETLEKEGRFEDRKIWLESLKEVAPVIDFTCSKNITHNRMNYSDAHHYRKKIGTLILEDVGRFLRGQNMKEGCLITP